MNEGLKGKEPQEAKRKTTIKGKKGELGKELKMRYVSRIVKIRYRQSAGNHIQGGPKK